MNDNQKTLMHYLIDIYSDSGTLDLLHVGGIFIKRFLAATCLKRYFLPMMTSPTMK